MYATRTGRLASENPNLQNIPMRSEDGRQIRAGFMASPGCVLSSLDLSQIEMVWAAELSQDHIMMEVYAAGQDLHVRTACALFRLDYERVAPLWARYKKGELTGDTLAEMRDFETNKRLSAKTLGFAVLYGVTPRGLGPQILAAGGPLFTEDECADYIRLWFALFSGVRDWLELQYSRVRRYGMNWTAFGRPRIIPEIHSTLQGVRNAALRQAGNHPDQGTAGDHLKLAMAEIMDGPVEYYRGLGVPCDPLLQVHDELIFDLDPAIAEEFNSWAGDIMCNAVRPMAVRVKYSAAVADNWGGLK
jgi:DNA polymerase-1